MTVLAFILVPPFTDFSKEPDIAGGRRDMNAELAEVRDWRLQVNGYLLLTSVPWYYGRLFGELGILIHGAARFCTPKRCVKAGVDYLMQVFILWDTEWNQKVRSWSSCVLLSAG